MNSVLKGGANFVSLTLSITNLILNERKELNILKEQIRNVLESQEFKGLSDKEIEEINEIKEKKELLEYLERQTNNDKEVKLALAFIVDTVFKPFVCMNIHDVELIRFCSSMRMHDDHIINLLVLDNAYLINDYLQSIGYGTLNYKIIGYRKNAEFFRINQLYK